MRLRLAIAGVVVCMAARALAQSDPQAPLAQAPTLSAQSTLVLVPALVRNKAGQLIYTLKASDFALTDDGVPQKLRLEQDTDREPLALVVDIEGGGQAARELEIGKFSGISSMLDAIVGGVPHRIAVVGFDSSPALVTDFTPMTPRPPRAASARLDCRRQRGRRRGHPGLARLLSSTCCASVSRRSTAARSCSSARPTAARAS